ncbi:MAG: citryl-CoA lyase, partial [Methanothermobacter thermautotrophicus]|nr:citryl-CoA lyase [Methanothermobacter thermautotrophicus]
MNKGALNALKFKYMKIRWSDMMNEGIINDILRVKNPRWRTSITRVEPNRIVTRGYSQEDLIGGVS